MRNSFLVSAAAIVLMASSGLANAQESSETSREQSGAATQQNITARFIESRGEGAFIRYEVDPLGRKLRYEVDTVTRKNTGAQSTQKEEKSGAKSTQSEEKSGAARSKKRREKLTAVRSRKHVRRASPTAARI